MNVGTKTLEATLADCRFHGYNEAFTREVLWNTAYALGRSRWYWGPRWFVTLTGWFNTITRRKVWFDPQNYRKEPQDFWGETPGYGRPLGGCVCPKCEALRRVAE